MAALMLLALSAPVWGAGRRERAVTAGAPGSAGVVALTFDDGPRRKTTQALLDGLARRGVSVTFFLIGLKVPGNEDLILRMEEEGHQVGIHAQNHEMILSPEAAAREVDSLRETLAGLLGRRDFMVRPPYGKTTAQARAAVGAPIILWSVDPEDWRDGDVDRIVAGVVEHVQDGDIILLHDLYSSTVDAAVQIVDALLNKGYCFVTVEQLLEWNGITPQKGVCYRSGRP